MLKEADDKLTWKLLAYLSSGFYARSGTCKKAALSL